MSRGQEGRAGRQRSLFEQACFGPCAMLVAVSFFGESVFVPEDPSAAAWIEPRIGAFGTVGGLVPNAYDAYLVMDHGTEDAEPRDAPKELVAGVASVVAGHTMTPTAAWFGIWVGYGWESARTLIFTGASWRERRRIRRKDERRSEENLDELPTIPRFSLPGREYFLLAGPVEAASRIEPAVGWGSHPPDLWWPADRAWFVASDTDLSWTYLAGAPELVEEVAARHPGRTRLVERTATNLSAHP